VIISASILYGAGNLFTGPSQLLALPLSLKLMMFGQLILGTCGGLMIVPSLPEMIDSLREKYPGQEEEVGLQASGVFNSILATGQILGPIYATTSV
jgi:hypothetical protein